MRARNGVTGMGREGKKNRKFYKKKNRQTQIFTNYSGKGKRRNKH